MLTADQYIAIVLPGRMFKAEYNKRGLHEKNLARALEDAGTITSPLVPWNTCGAYMAATLGVPTLAYLPFCFFNLGESTRVGGLRIHRLQDRTHRRPGGCNHRTGPDRLSRLPQSIDNHRPDALPPHASGRRRC